LGFLSSFSTKILYAFIICHAYITRLSDHT
jgi:hypothetical protein